jgi:hypothetical protein
VQRYVPDPAQHPPVEISMSPMRSDATARSASSSFWRAFRLRSCSVLSSMRSSYSLLCCRNVSLASPGHHAAPIDQMIRTADEARRSFSASFCLRVIFFFGAAAVVFLPTGFFSSVSDLSQSSWILLVQIPRPSTSARARACARACARAPRPSTYLILALPLVDHGPRHGGSGGGGGGLVNVCRVLVRRKSFLGHTPVVVRHDDSLYLCGLKEMEMRR